MAKRLALTLLAVCLCLDGQQLRVKLSGRAALLSMDIEDYVAAAVAGEAGGFKSMEALKAMAVAARTFARANLNRHRAQGYDLCETTHCQDLRLNSVDIRHRAAAEATAGEILWYNGRPARIFYTEHCGGHTESASAVWPRSAAPYLRGVKDDFCLSAGKQSWSSAIPLVELARALGLPAIESIAVTRRTAANRAAKVSTNGRFFSAESFHIAVGRVFGWDRLRSTQFIVEVRGADAYFTGSGRGHGVGLCQVGAEQRGLAGHDYRRILAAYFPGTRIGVAARDIPWVSVRTRRADIRATASEPAGPVIAAVDRVIARAEVLTGRKFELRPEIRVYPGVDVYRDATGEPGFVAAATRGRVIHLQSAHRLIAQGRLDSVLTHEMVHILIDNHAALPRWFAEGLALELENPGSVKPAALSPSTEPVLWRPPNEPRLRAAYSNAQAAVAALIMKHGRAKVISWIDSGLPAGLQ